MSEAEQVKEFVFGKCLDASDLSDIPNPEPKDPIPMTKEDVMNAGSFIISEVVELLNTVESDSEKVSGMALKCLNRAINDTQFQPTSSSKRKTVAEQCDSLVDISYFAFFFGAKHGLRMQEAFKVVHKANMAKKFKTTGAFHKRPGDRKIIKPDDWKAPNMEELFQDISE